MQNPGRVISGQTFSELAEQAAGAQIVAVIEPEKSGEQPFARNIKSQHCLDVLKRTGVDRVVKFYLALDNASR